tara:strand:- start:18 stop:584 length:567 start_codon:yes stop_codon:yes gene_type:complete
MVNYNQGKIYKLCCKDVNVKEIYIGSTCNELKVRKYKHKSICINENSKAYNLNIYQFIRQSGGFDNWDIVLVEEYKDCNNKNDLHARERYYIELLESTLNSRIPIRSQQEYKEYHKEYKKTDKHKEYKKQYEKTDKRKEYKKQYNKTDKMKEYQKEYHKTTKIKCELCDKEMRKDSLNRHKKNIHNLI